MSEISDLINNANEIEVADLATNNKMLDRVGDDLADAVLSVLVENPAFDELDAADRELVFYIVRRKAAILNSIEIGRKTKNHKLIADARKSVADIKSIEASLALIAELRVVEILRAKAKELALAAVGFALKIVI